MSENQIVLITAAVRHLVFRENMCIHPHVWVVRDHPTQFASLCFTCCDAPRHLRAEKQDEEGQWLLNISCQKSSPHIPSKINRSFYPSFGLTLTHFQHCSNAALQPPVHLSPTINLSFILPSATRHNCTSSPWFGSPNQGSTLKPPTSSHLTSTYILSLHRTIVRWHDCVQ